jgi:hypothetical protein
MSNNLEILITQDVRRVMPRLEVFALYQKKASSMKLADLRDMFKKASKQVCTSTIVVSPDPLSPTPTTLSTVKTAENTDDDPDGSEPEDEGDIHMKYSPGWLCSLHIGVVTENYL